MDGAFCNRRVVLGRLVCNGVMATQLLLLCCPILHWLISCYNHLACKAIICAQIWRHTMGSSVCHKVDTNLLLGGLNTTHSVQCAMIRTIKCDFQYDGKHELC